MKLPTTFALVLLCVACGGTTTTPEADPPAAPAAGAAGGDAAVPGAEGPKRASKDALQTCAEKPAPGCFVEIRGGTFTMGAQATDAAAPRYDALARPEEGPPHTVTLKSYWIQGTEAPQAMLSRCRSEGGCTGPPIPDDESTRDLPAHSITWSDAADLCAWLGGRLPTEAEWEYAARAGGEHRFAWGNAPICPPSTQAARASVDAHRQALMQRCGGVLAAVFDQFTPDQLNEVASAADAWTVEEVDAICPAIANLPPDAMSAALLERARARLKQLASSQEPARCDRPDPIGVVRLYDRHPWALYGVSGNVAEWVQDGFNPTVYASSPADASAAPAAADGRRVVRSGSFMSASTDEWRTTARAGMPADLASRDTGVRCVRESAP
jgi:formylglycine-generating enzyme required for sulfatase activity